MAIDQTPTTMAWHSELAVLPTMAQPLPPAQHATNLSLQGRVNAAVTGTTPASSTAARQGVR